jgi:non-specific serine/threonine protein kinase
VSSPELVRDEVLPERGTAQPAAWRIPALTLDADDVLPLVRGLDPAETGVVAGASLHHLLDIAGFADDLVGRGRVLPIVVPDPRARSGDHC